MRFCERVHQYFYVSAIARKIYHKWRFENFEEDNPKHDKCIWCFYCFLLFDNYMRHFLNPCTLIKKHCFSRIDARRNFQKYQCWLHTTWVKDILILILFYFSCIFRCSHLILPFCYSANERTKIHTWALHFNVYNSEKNSNDKICIALENQNTGKRKQTTHFVTSNSTKNVFRILILTVQHILFRNIIF